MSIWPGVPDEKRSLRARLLSAILVEAEVEAEVEGLFKDAKNSSRFF